MAACVLSSVNMKLLAALISIISLAGFSWAACPIPNPSNPSAGQESALENLRQTGFKYSGEGHYRNAAACYQEALHTAQAQGISNTTVATDLQNLALLAEEMGNYSDARNYYSRELDLLNHLGAASSVAAGEAYLELGGLTQIQGSLSEAESHYKKAVGLFTQHAGAENLRTAKALARLGRLYMEWGQFAEASTLLRKARVTAEKSLPENDPKLIGSGGPQLADYLLVLILGGEEFFDPRGIAGQHFGGSGKDRKSVV